MNSQTIVNEAVDSVRNAADSQSDFQMHELKSPMFPKEVVRKLYDLAVGKNLKPVYEERPEQTLCRVFCSATNWAFLRMEAMS